MGGAGSWSPRHPGVGRERGDASRETPFLVQGGPVPCLRVSIRLSICPLWGLFLQNESEALSPGTVGSGGGGREGRRGLEAVCHQQRGVWLRDRAGGEPGGGVGVPLPPRKPSHFLRERLSGRQAQCRLGSCRHPQGHSRAIAMDLPCRLLVAWALSLWPGRCPAPWTLTSDPSLKPHSREWELCSWDGTWGCESQGRRQLHQRGRYLGP